MICSLISSCLDLFRWFRSSVASSFSRSLRSERALFCPPIAVLYSPFLRPAAAALSWSRVSRFCDCWSALRSSDARLGFSKASKVALLKRIVSSRSYLPARTVWRRSIGASLALSFPSPSTLGWLSLGWPSGLEVACLSGAFASDFFSWANTEALLAQASSARTLHRIRLFISTAPSFVQINQRNPLSSSYRSSRSGLPVLESCRGPNPSTH